jgi:hypothetical protein
MTSKKLGALLQSVPPATAHAESVTPSSKGQPETRRAAPMPVTREEAEVPLQVLVPARIREELGILAAKERQSLRALILRAVRSLGVEVSEAEIRGKRGRRHGS